MKYYHCPHCAFSAGHADRCPISHAVKAGMAAYGVVASPSVAIDETLTDLGLKGAAHTDASDRALTMVHRKIQELSHA